jgi:hypothetical protein
LQTKGKETMLCTEDIRAAEGCNHNFISDEDVGGCLEARWRDLEVSFVLDTQTLRFGRPHRFHEVAVAHVPSGTEAATGPVQ